MKEKFSKQKKGYILTFALIILSVFLLLSLYFLSFSFTGFKMAKVYEKSLQAYYLAEAGIQEAIFKLKTDPNWKSAFETLPTISDPNCSSWEIPDYPRNPALFSDGSYKISIENLGCAKAKIFATSTLGLENQKSQRVVQMIVSKPLGSPLKDYTLFTSGPSGDIQISGVNPLNIYAGSLFANNDIIVKNYSKINAQNKILAANNVNILSGSQIIANAICAKNICQENCSSTKECPSQQLPMPALDFDSNASTSYYQKAINSDCSSIRTDGKTNCLFTQDEFEKLMWQNYPSLSLPTSTSVYVKGDINIRAGQILKVNGVLIADRDINLGQDYCWVRPEPPYLRCGFSQLFVKKPGENLASGILAKRKINGGGWLGIGLIALDVEGLVYAGDEISLTDFLAPSTIKGGIAARKFSLTSLWQDFNLYLDQNVVGATFGTTSYSPIISIEHWEEVY